MARWLIPLLVVVACSSKATHSTGDCTPGTSQACVGPGQCAGSQICADDGEGFGECQCAGGSGGTAGSGAVGGSGAAGGGSGGVGTGGAPACDAPQLLVGKEHLSNGPGAVLRWSLAGGTSSRCADLTGDVPAQPFAVAAMPSGRIAVGTWSEVRLLIPEQNRAAWSHPLSSTQDYPVDLFPLRDPGSGEWRLAVAYRGPNTLSDITRIDVHELVGGSEVASWTLNSGGFPLSLGWTGMTVHPLDPTHLLAMKPGDWIAAREVDPFAGSAIPGDLPAPAPLKTIAALLATPARVVWVGGANTDTVYALQAPPDGVSPGSICSNLICEMAHAVPDPTDPARAFALCGSSGSVVRRVVRLRVDEATPNCEVVFDSNSLGTSVRLSHLAIVE